MSRLAATEKVHLVPEARLKDAGLTNPESCRAISRPFKLHIASGNMPYISSCQAQQMPVCDLVIDRSERH